MGDCFYVPAGVNRINRPLKKDLPMLGSAATLMGKTKYDEFKELANSSYSSSILIDSGGYKIGQLEKNGALESSKILYSLTNELVMCIAGEVGADIVVGLDYPLRGYDRDAERNMEFQKKMPINQILARDAIKKHRQICPDIELYLAVQAYNPEQFRFVVDNLDPEYDGLAFPVCNYQPIKLIENLFLLIARGVRKVHFLGSSTPVVAMIATFFSKYFVRITYDSTTWMQHANKMNYLHSQNLSVVSMKGGQLPKKIGQCDCLACRYHNFREFWNIPKGDLPYAIGRHNYAVFERVHEMFMSNASSLDTLSQVIDGFNFSKITSNRLRSVVDLIAKYEAGYKLFGPEDFDCFCKLLV